MAVWRHNRTQRYRGKAARKRSKQRVMPPEGAVPVATLGRKNLSMARAPHLYRYSLDDRSTDFADLERATTAETALASWNARQHSNLVRPSRVGDRIQERRRDEAPQERTITLGLLLLSVAVTAVIFFFAQR